MGSKLSPTSGLSSSDAERLWIALSRIICGTMLVGTDFTFTGDSLLRGFNFGESQAVAVEALRDTGETRWSRDDGE